MTEVTAPTATEDDLRYKSSVSVRYHRYREAFFQRLSDWIAFISIVSGTSVVVSILATAPEIYGLVSGVVVAVAQALSLVGRFDDKSRLHGQLAGEHLQILQAIAMNTPLDAEQVRANDAALLAIELREPPIYGYLEMRCYNEYCGSIGTPSKVHKLTWLQANFANFLPGRADGIY